MNIFFNNSKFTLNHSKLSGSDQKCFLSSKQSRSTYKIMFCNLHLKISVKCQRGEGDHNKLVQIFELFFNNSQIFPQITPDLLEVIENVFFGPNDDFQLVRTCQRAGEGGGDASGS